jgi:uncharacterized membrane protein
MAHDETAAQASSSIRPDSTRERIDLLVSRVLRWGVLCAAAIGAAGFLLFVLRGPQPGDPQTLQELLSLRSETFATSLPAMVRGISTARPDDVMRLGILVLILTPLLRVALMLVLFVLERDFVFVAISAIVFAILLLGLTGSIGR